MGYPGPRRRGAFHAHMRREWQRFQRGTLHSGARTGPIVRTVSQYQAVALTSARAKHLRGAPPAPKG
jgi:hypothetical protein